MKLKLLFCQCVKKLVESYNEGMNITQIENLVSSEDLPEFLVERMDRALKIIANKVMTHGSITLTDHEEAIEDLQGKADTTGVNSLLLAIEKSGLNCLEVISLIELKDILIEPEKTDSATVTQSDSLSVPIVTRKMTFDAFIELNKFQPTSLAEKAQLQSGDVIESEVRR